MALSLRQKMFFFVGLNIAMYGLALIILGAWSTEYFVHGAAGASMWIGIFLIMCGVWNIIIAVDADQDPKDNIAGISLSGLFVNMVAIFGGILVIAFGSWAANDFIEQGITYGRNGTERQIELFVTIVLLGGFTLILGLLALMVDCCCGALFDPVIPAVNPADPYGLNNGGAYPYPPRY